MKLFKSSGINYPAAELRGMSLPHGIKQSRMLVVYFCIRSTLVFDIVFDGLLVAILADGVDIVPFRPEFASPQFPFHLRVRREDHFGCDAFDRLSKS